MSNQRFTPEFKEEAVRQIVERGYTVAEVSARLGVSSHSLYQWMKSVKPDKTESVARLYLYGYNLPCRRSLPLSSSRSYGLQARRRT
jgi:transposase-like protein